MLSGLVAGALAWLAGAKRWLNREMALAIGIVGVALVLAIGGALLHRAGGTAASARVNWQWLSQIAEMNRKRAERRAADMAAQAAAAAAARARAEAERDEALERAIALERELGAMKGPDTEIYSQAERRKLFR